MRPLEIMTILSLIATLSSCMTGNSSNCLVSLTKDSTEKFSLELKGIHSVNAIYFSSTTGERLWAFSRHPGDQSNLISAKTVSFEYGEVPSGFRQKYPPKKPKNIRNPDDASTPQILPLEKPTLIQISYTRKNWIDISAAQKDYILENGDLYEARVINGNWQKGTPVQPKN